MEKIGTLLFLQLRLMIYLSLLVQAWFWDIFIPVKGSQRSNRLNLLN